MPNTVLLSAITVIALTGITLTSLKYRNNDENFNLIDDDYDDNNSSESLHVNKVNPKFHFYDTEQHKKNHSVTKRSDKTVIEYSVRDRNVLRVDEVKREKVKQVQRDDLKTFIWFEFIQNPLRSSPSLTTQIIITLITSICAALSCHSPYH